MGDGFGDDNPCLRREHRSGRGRAKTRTVSNHDLNQRSSLPLERAAKNIFGTGGLRPSSSGYPASWRYLRTILNAISRDCS